MYSDVQGVPMSDHHPGDLARRITARRTELGLDLETVATASGIPADYCRYLEQHATLPTRETLYRLAQALDTTPARLLGEDTPLVSEG